MVDAFDGMVIDFVLEVDTVGSLDGVLCARAACGVLGLNVMFDFGSDAVVAFPFDAFADLGLGEEVDLGSFNVGVDDFFNTTIFGSDAVIALANDPFDDFGFGDDEFVFDSATAGAITFCATADF